ncbi:hypothetical protein AB4Z22_29435, partial [Paenibacillus sp. TAF58]
MNNVVISTTIHMPKGYFVSSSCRLYNISSPFVAKWPVWGSIVVHYATTKGNRQDLGRIVALNTTSLNREDGFIQTPYSNYFPRVILNLSYSLIINVNRPERGHFFQSVHHSG